MEELACVMVRVHGFVCGGGGGHGGGGVGMGREE